jgi:NAD(P)-dependent dehydrogenase (short-subunit alcohol dehydrogenase family)
MSKVHPITRIPARWRASDIGDLRGKRFLITGGTSGIGLESAREIARAGGDVIIAARDPIKAQRTTLSLGASRVSWIEADLSNLLSIRSAVRKVEGEIDVLILNAGIMAIPFMKSSDDLEMQMAVNHFGHFALANLLREKIRDRVISVSSVAHKMGDFGSGSIDEIESRSRGDFEDLNMEYSPWRVYGASKLANILFTFELERLARKSGASFISAVVHPGYSNTNLQYLAPELSGDLRKVQGMKIVNKIVAQSAAMGALPTLAAATIPGISGGSFIGPGGMIEMRGHPKFVRARQLAYDQQLARNLWHVSEEITGVKWS